MMLGNEAKSTGSTREFELFLGIVFNSQIEKFKMTDGMFAVDQLAAQGTRQCRDVVCVEWENGSWHRLSFIET